jgi:RNA recognition motif-containing protein
MRHVLYVGGLSAAVTANQLKDLFAAYGQVPWARVERQRDESTSYGFVQLTSGAEALRAVVELDGTIVDDTCLQVYLTPLHAARGRGQRLSKTRRERRGSLNVYEGNHLSSQ